MFTIFCLAHASSSAWNIQPVKNEISSSCDVTASTSSNTTKVSSGELVTQTTSFSTRLNNDAATADTWDSAQEQSTDVIMYAEHDSYPAGVDVVNVTLESRDGKCFGFGRHFEVEKLDGSDWVKVPFKKYACFQEIWIMAVVNPDTGIAKTVEYIELNKLQSKLTNGSYRISKKVGNQIIYANFKIQP